MTNSKDAPGTNIIRVFKQDALPQVKTPAARRDHLLDEFERSGLSGKKFAARVGIKYQTFATWVQRRRRQQPGASTGNSSAPVRWLEAVVDQAQSLPQQASSPLVLLLPGGARIEINEPQQARLAAALLRALGAPASSQQPPQSC